MMPLKNMKTMKTLDTIVDLAPRLRRKEISPVELTRDCLDRIDQLNPTLNAFITVTAESALAEARAAEKEISHGDWRGPLHGIPIALKDLIDTAGTRTTAASQLYENRIPAEDAEVVRRLRRAGAVILGKNNLHEFAYGASSLVSFFGAVHHPRNPAHIAGGSSGGSAAAVAAVRRGLSAAGLPEDAVVEVPCTVDRDGAHPLPQRCLPPDMAGLVAHCKAYERLAVEAALSGSRDTMIRALVANPLVGQYPLAEQLADTLLTANRRFLPRFFPDAR